jgi:hypothetical protein
MTNMKISIIAFLLIVLAFTSCSKTNDLVPAAPSTTTAVSPSVITLNDVSTSQDFNWSTTREIQFNFNGKDAQGYNLVLKVMDTEGNVIMQKMQKSDQSFQTYLKIPSSYKTLVIAYGADTKNIDCTSGSASMSINY